MTIFKLKDLAEAGYIMGLSTIGEVASHVTSHYDAYFSIKHLDSELYDFETLIAGHEDDSIDLYLNELDKIRMDAELEEAMAQSPGERPGDGEFPIG
jgi:hypothetical protein